MLTRYRLNYKLTGQVRLLLLTSLVYINYYRGILSLSDC